MADTIYCKHCQAHIMKLGWLIHLKEYHRQSNGIIRNRTLNPRKEILLGKQKTLFENFNYNRQRIDI